MYESRIDLEPALRSDVIRLLQPLLVDAVDLHSQVKQAHWNVKGPSFIALHELFDKIAEEVEDHSDSLAERITALGGRADGTARAAAAGSRLQEYPPDIVDGTAHLTAVAKRLATFGAAARVTIDNTTQLGDADSADLCTEVSRSIDKQLWFVEAHLQARE